MIILLLGEVESYQDGIFEAGEIVFAPWILQVGNSAESTYGGLGHWVDDVHQFFVATLVIGFAVS